MQKICHLNPDNLENGRQQPLFPDLDRTSGMQHFHTVFVCLEFFKLKYYNIYRTNLESKWLDKSFYSKERVEFVMIVLRYLFRQVATLYSCKMLLFDNSPTTYRNRNLRWEPINMIIDDIIFRRCKSTSCPKMLRFRKSSLENDRRFLNN